MSDDVGQVSIATTDGEMPAHRWVPRRGSGPGLVLLQEIFGVTDYIRRRAADLAAMGYVVLAPELYWRLGSETVDESAEDFLEQAMALAQRLDWETTVADAAGSLAYLRSDPAVADGCGVVGFCFGGGVAFQVAAVEEPDVLVAYYGSAIPELLSMAERVTAPSLHHLGLADAYLDAPALARSLSASGPHVQVQTHEGAGHAFDNPAPGLHHAPASARAWASTAAFLGRQLPV